jgi:DNA processing protein
MGVDAVAHQTTIANGGKTIAVLGCGVDCCYPRENEKLYDDIIASGGAILSEVPIGMRQLWVHFLREIASLPVYQRCISD